jgi:hypothetical protein
MNWATVQAWRCLLWGASRAELLEQLAAARERIMTLEGRLQHSNEARNAAQHGLKAVRYQAARDAWDKADKLIGQLQSVIHKQLLVEPPEVEGCVKTRLHTREEAQEFAALLAQRMGYEPADFKAYQCKACPRHPATAQRFWHVTSASKEMSQESRSRGSAKFQQAKHEGRLLEQRVDLTGWLSQQGGRR